MSESSLFRALCVEWEAEAATPPARVALGRWATKHRELSGYSSPSAVVASCHGRVDDQRCQALLRAVLAEASDDAWAARTFLQAVLPGLGGVARRASGFVRIGIWETPAELDQHVVATAYERIHALAPRPPLWPAVAVVDGTWQRVRAYGLCEAGRRRRRVAIDDVSARHLASTESGRSPAEELTSALIEGVRRGLVEPSDAALVYSSRVRGQGVADLAVVLGREAHWLFRRRAQVERLLLAAVAQGAWPSTGSSPRSAYIDNGRGR